MTTLAIAAAIVLLLVGGSAPVAAATDATPRVISVHHDSPGAAVQGDGAMDDIASVLLPKGQWLVTASATFINHSETDNHQVRCRLVVSGKADVTVLGLGRVGGVYVKPLFSQVTRAINSVNGALAHWRCGVLDGATGSVEAEWIRLTGIELGALTETNLATGGTSTTGSGAPQVVSAYDEGPLDVADDTVTSFHVPRGSWLLTAKAVATNTAFGRRDVRCAMQPGNDVAKGVLSSPDQVHGVDSLVWLGAASFGFDGGDVSLICYSLDGDPGDVQLTHIRFVAFRAPSLSVTQYPGAAGSLDDSAVQVAYGTSRRTPGGTGRRGCGTCRTLAGSRSARWS